MMMVCDVHSYWQAKVMALSDDAKWMDLERFSKSKKPPPIGFEVCTVCVCVCVYACVCVLTSM